jgi:catechol 2,3-dioxygenase-like lactoylglutathione lyase family enzyme
MDVRRIAWLGVRTERAEAMVAFFKDTLGLGLQYAEDGQWEFSLPEGGKADPSSPTKATPRGFTSARPTATSTS